MNDSIRRSSREFAARTALVAGSVLSMLVLGEIGLRVYHGGGPGESGSVADALAESAVADLSAGDAGDSAIKLQGLVRESPFPDIVYELKPDLKGSFLGKPLETSSIGTRDTERSREKPAGVYRIIGLGDSVMFGWGVAQDEVYTAVLEGRLRRVATPERDYEVLNFAVPGYNTAMQVATLEHRALEYDPDLVLVHFVPNDLNLPYFLRRPRRSWRLDEWYVLDLIRFGWRAASGVGDDFVPFNEPEIPESELRRLEGPYRRMVGEEGYRRSMATLARLAEERSFAVVVLLMAEKHRLAGLVREVAAEHGMELLTPRHRFKEYLTREGLAVETWDETFRIPADGHPNAVAHAVYAAALRRWLVDRGVVPAHRAPVSARPASLDPSLGPE